MALDRFEEAMDLGPDIRRVRRDVAVSAELEVQGSRERTFIRSERIEKVLGLIAARAAEREEVIGADFQTSGLGLFPVRGKPPVAMITTFRSLDEGEAHIVIGYFVPVDLFLVV
nr:hypothetical protein [Microvirga sp. Mcv34]